MAYKLSNIKKPDPVDTPCKKTIYTTVEEVLDAIRYINETRSGKELRPYKCLTCGFWHLTSKKDNWKSGKR